MLTEAWLLLSRGFSMGGRTNPVGGRPVGNTSIPERRIHRLKEHHLLATSVSGKEHQVSGGQPQSHPGDALYLRASSLRELPAEFFPAPPEGQR